MKITWNPGFKSGEIPGKNNLTVKLFKHIDTHLKKLYVCMCIYRYVYVNLHMFLYISVLLELFKRVMKNYWKRDLNLAPDESKKNKSTVLSEFLKDASEIKTENAQLTWEPRLTCPPLMHSCRERGGCQDLSRGPVISTYKNQGKNNQFEGLDYSLYSTYVSIVSQKHNSISADNL